MEKPFFKNVTHFENYDLARTMIYIHVRTDGYATHIVRYMFARHSEIYIQ